MAIQHAGIVTTWQAFQDAFHGYHILDGLMDIKKEGFCNLTQGRKIVDEYSREFTRLAHYARDEASTNAQKQARFRKGLNPSIKILLSLINF